MSTSPDALLPAGIGKPAFRALSAAGITHLHQIATQSDDDLLALHGVGPKAVRLLRAALEEIHETSEERL